LKNKIFTVNNFSAAHTDLWVRNVDNDYRRNECAQDILKEDFDKNIRTYKKEWLNNKNKQGDKRRIARERYCKIYKIPPTKLVWSC
jgi:hypothetical protein